MTSFEGTCNLIGKIPAVASAPESIKYKEKRELTPDEFISLYKVIKYFRQRY